MFSTNSLPHRKLTRWILATSFLTLASATLRADPLDHWHLRHPFLQMEAFTHVSYGGGLWVAVGDYGKIQTSPDGRNWALRFSDPSAGSLVASAYGAGRFVSVSTAGWILTSSNGVAWTNLPVSSPSLSSITYGNGRFVAVGH